MDRSPRRGRVILAALSALVSVGACSASDTTDRGVSTASSVNVGANVNAPLEFDIELPEGHSLVDTTIGAAEDLVIGPRDQAAGSLASGAGPVVLLPGANSGAITTGGDVSLFDGVRVAGNVVAGKMIDASRSAVVTGSKQPGASVPATTVSWTVSESGASQGDIALHRGSTAAPDPGIYGDVAVDSGSTLYLRTGTYFFKDFELAQHATLSIDSRTGPVFLYLIDSLAYQGDEVSVDSGPPALFVGYFGTREATLEAPFNGVFLAPNAKLHLHAGSSCFDPDGGHGGDFHEEHDHPWGWPFFGWTKETLRPATFDHGTVTNMAAFYAKVFVADPGETITPTFFDWSTVPGLPPPPGGWASTIGPVGNVPVTNATIPGPAVDISVNIADTGTGATTSSANPPSPVPFTLPLTFEVAGGEIANGTVTLHFTGANGKPVTCLYQGGAPTATPTSPIDLNAGRLLTFVSCSDGLGANVQRHGTNFTLTVAPAPHWPVQIHLLLDDRSCSATFEMITGYDTRRLHDAFSWQAAKTVDEKTPDGQPTLYYAWVYVRNRDDLLNLERMYVHILSRPLFTQELNQYAGKCGTFVNLGDGGGMMVPVLMPGLVYNTLVRVVQNPGGNNIMGNPVVFDAVVLRNSEVPAGARNADGSVNLTMLAQSGFKYLDYMPQPLPAQNDIQLSGSAAAVLVAAVEFVQNAVKDVGHAITSAIGSVDAFFSGRTTVSMKINVINLDSNFGTNVDMVRAWGPLAGASLGAAGLRVELLENLAQIIPETFSSDTNDNGQVVIRPAAHNRATGAGFCVELSNPAAQIAGFLTATNLCDFSAFDSNQPNGDSPTDFELSDFTQDHNVNLHVSSVPLATIYEMTDVYKYFTDVAGYSAHKAHVLFGAWANTWSHGGLPYTACLWLRNLALSDLTTRITTFAQRFDSVSELATNEVIALVGAFIGESDIIVPDDQSPISTTREVGSHEYGHFELCNLINDQSPTALDGLIFDSAFGIATEGNDLTLPTRYINEAFADFVSGQVTSIANYHWLDVGGAENGKVCTSNIKHACYDQNDTARQPPASDSDRADIARIATLLHDVFDGHNHRCGDVPADNLCAAVPNDADAWTQDPTTGFFSYSPTGYGNFDGPGSTTLKESVALPGSSIVALGKNLASSSFVSTPLSAAPNLYNDSTLFPAVNTTMLAGGANWCQRCQVFALHSTTLTSDQVDGLSPHDLLNVCTGQDPLIQGVLGSPPDPDLRLDIASCQPCKAGFVSNAQGVCTFCPFTIIGDQCVQCPADVEIDGNTAPLGSEIFDTTTKAPNDTCPNTFWLQVDHPDAFFTRGATELDTTLLFPSATASNCIGSFSLTFEPQAASGFVSASDNTSTLPADFNDCGGGGNCFGAGCVNFPSFSVGSVGQLPIVGGAVGGIRYGTPSIAGVQLSFDAFQATITK